MFKNYCFFTLFVASPFLVAQVQFQDKITWDEDPLVVSWNGEAHTFHEYRIIPLGGPDNFWGDSKEVEKVSERPSYLRSFAAEPNRNYIVEVVNVNLEPISLPSGSTVDLPSELTFNVSVSQQPEGWLGKVFAPALLRTASGVARLTFLDIRLVSTGGAARPRSDFATNSVLGEGTWFRFNVQETGVHKLTREFLTDELKMNLGGVDPRDIAIYGQSTTGKLPETINLTSPDDLVEIPISVEGESDGSFDAGDFIVFHALGPDPLVYNESLNRYDYEKNIYTNTNSYFLRVGNARGRRVSSLPTVSGGTVTDSYDAVYHFEEDKFNILHELGGNAHGSGQSWWGDFFKASREKEYKNLFRIPGFIPDESARLRARMALRTDASSNFFLEYEDQRIASSTASRIRFGAQEQSVAAVPSLLEGDIQLVDESFSVNLDYPIPSNADGSEGWLDWIQLRVRRKLTFGSLEQFDFRDTRNSNESLVSYRFEEFPTDAVVWRVDGADIRSATVSENRFNAVAGGSLFNFVAFRKNAKLLVPIPVGAVKNQNLHALRDAEMVIIAHEKFLSQAEELADHRRTHDGLKVVVATTQQVYNEFSSGRDDAAALRNFTRMMYERSDNLEYLLLFGDGSFDHRDVLELGTNFIPAYEHDGRLTEVGSFPSDDFYGIMSLASNGQPLEPDISVAVGRLPVKTADEATEIVKKLIRYDLNPNSLGEWRTRMVFVGDDEDGNIHMRDVNRVANSVVAMKPDLNFDKLYFDLFPQQSLSAGDRFPSITEGLDRAVLRGALAVTYLGHGGPRGWAQERVLTIPQIRNWNKPPNAADPINPPIFITATCTFSNYDDASFISAGEEALLTPNGGAVALLTTTRPVFATRNFQLTDATARAMAARPNGKWRTLGQVLRTAKNEETTPSNGSILAGTTENSRKFTLLGDPAMVIAFPEYRVRTTAINNEPILASRQDTVQALQKISISGELTDLANNVLEDFTGFVYPTVFDKAKTVATLQQDQPTVSPLQVSVQKNIVFRGKAKVVAGKFSFEFVVPRDIDYSYGTAKISYYAADVSKLKDASGFYDKLIIGGTNTESINDNEGPIVEVFMDSEDFVSGSETSKDPVLLVSLSDDLGINVTGNSIGHDLEAILDDDTRSSILLNDYYEAETDNFRKGKVRYSLFDLKPGKHTITVRAWDAANNSAIGKTEFIVTTNETDAISRVFNYPNPFTNQTCFQFDHTIIGQEVEALVQIYTINGRLVKTITKNYPFSDGSVRQDDCIQWDGLDEYGDKLARGVYLYQIRLKGSEGTIVDGVLEKLVIL